MKYAFIPLYFALALATASASIVSYLRFEEGSGFGAFDEIGLMDGEVLDFSDVSPGGGDTGPQGWSVSVPSAVVPQTGSANTGSMRFAGGSAIIDLSNPNALSLGTEFTIELYFRPDEPGLGGSLFAFSPVSSMGFSLSDTLGDLYFNSGFQGFMASPILANDVRIGEWQHLAMVKEQGQYSIYLDGILLATQGLPPETDGPYFFPGTPLTGSRTLGDGFSGYIDEFRISDTALTPDQFLIVPEPGTLGLVGLGGLALLVMRRGRGIRKFSQS